MCACLFVVLSVVSLCWFVRGVFVLVCVCVCVCVSGCPPGEEVLLARIQPEVQGAPFGGLPISNKRRILYLCEEEVMAGGPNL